MEKISSKQNCQICTRNFKCKQKSFAHADWKISTTNINKIKQNTFHKLWIVNTRVSELIQLYSATLALRINVYTHWKHRTSRCVASVKCCAADTNGCVPIWNAACAWVYGLFTCYTWRTNKRTKLTHLSRKTIAVVKRRSSLSLGLLRSAQSLSLCFSFSWKPLHKSALLLLLFAFGSCLMCHEIRGKAFAVCNPICTILHCIAHTLHIVVQQELWKYIIIFLFLLHLIHSAYLVCG